METNTWSVRGSVAVDLITTQDNKVGFLFIQNPRDKVQSARIGFALAPVVAIRNGLTAYTNPGAKMQIANLHDFEAPIFADSGLRLLDLVRNTPAHRELDAEQRPPGIEK